MLNSNLKWQAGLNAIMHTRVDCSALHGRFAHIWSIVEVLFETAWNYRVRRSFPPSLVAHGLLVEGRYGW